MGNLHTTRRAHSPAIFHKVTSAILTSSESSLHHMRSKHGTNAPSLPPQEKNFQLSRATSYPVSLTKQSSVFSASHHAPSYASSLALIATRRPIPHVATIPAAQSSLSALSLDSAKGTQYLYLALLPLHMYPQMETGGLHRNASIYIDLMFVLVALSPASSVLANRSTIHSNLVQGPLLPFLLPFSVRFGLSARCTRSLAETQEQSACHLHLRHADHAWMSVVNFPLNRPPMPFIRYTASYP